MKTLFNLIALGSVAFISADSYGRPEGYRSGNWPSSNGGGYYQDQDQTYNDGRYYQGQPNNGNYNDQYSQQNPYDSQVQTQQNPSYRQNQPYDQNQSYGQDQRYSQQQQPRNTYRIDINQNPNNQKVVSDQDITKSIRNTLSSGWFSKGFQDVTFDVNNGNVNLNGTVDSLENKNKVEASVRKISGVRQVNNNIEIVKGSSKDYSPTELQNSEKKYPQDFASTSDDRQLNAKIRDKINGWFSKSHETLVLRTSDGIVIVSGTVDKPNDIQKITDSIKEIDGVKSVHNQLSAKNQ